MRLRMNVLLVAASTLALAAGCEEPKEIGPVAPPGFELVRQPTTPGETAQALGEQPTAALAASSKQAKDKTEPSIVANSPPTPIGQPTTTPSGLAYETMKEGDGPTAKSGDSVDMHYTGTFADGKKFDSSLDRGKPISITLGARQVIQGWDEGIPGMKVGEKRKLIIPANLAYGERGKGDIPPNTPLTFEVELVKINN
jgi:FKBP-type peptidyl-prolyl cis-trans isomerase